MGNQNKRQPQMHEIHKHYTHEYGENVLKINENMKISSRIQTLNNG